MTDKKAHGLLGLCVRAGQASFGEDGCLGAIRGGKCGLLILDGEGVTERVENPSNIRAFAEARGN